MKHFLIISRYYAICGDVTNREINTSKLQSACLSAFGNCWDNEQTADCMKNFLYGREDDEIYQYCPDGDNNVLVALTEKEIKIKCLVCYIMSIEALISNVMTDT